MRTIFIADGAHIQVVYGGIGTSDTWNSEIDRIDRLHSIFGTYCEEMEAAAVAQIAKCFQVPYIAIRIISNNIMNNGSYKLHVSSDCQIAVVKVCEEYIKICKRNN